MWRHITYLIWFYLIDDDFGIKCVGKDHADHLISCLQETYPIEIDQVGTTYCGMNIEWDYTKRWEIVDMPTYMPV